MAKKIRALWIIATNPVVSYPNFSVLQQAFENLEFLVVQDGFHPTPTTELAHLVLPAAIWGEKEGTYTNSERRVSKVIARSVRQERRGRISISFSPLRRSLENEMSCSPVGMARGMRLKNGGAYQPGRLCDYSAMTWEEIESKGGIQWGGERLYAEGKFQFEDGRAS